MNEIFPRAKGLRIGYDRKQVDAFLDLARVAYETNNPPLSSSRVRQVAFRLVKRGYVPDRVDAALDRLEQAFAEREREEYVALHGQAAWKDYLRGRIQKLVDRLNYPPKRRFDRESRLKRGYKPADVDVILRKILEYVQGRRQLVAKDIRGVVFGPKYGGYKEDHVDAFMDEVIAILIALD